jgi:hypothetical protein
MAHVVGLSRLLLLTTLLAGLIVFFVPGPAHAASVTVSGTGLFKSLTLKNDGDTVVLKVGGLGEPCTLRYLSVPLNDRDGTRYEFDAGCYPSTEPWQISLVRGQSLVDCPGLRLNHNAANTTYTARIPRSCLKGLANTIRAGAAYAQEGARDDNATRPTKYVQRSCAPTVPSC